MRLERGYFKIILVCLPLVVALFACKKRRAFKQENGQAAEDVRRFQEQNDAIINDLNIVIMEQALLRGGSPTQENVSTRLCGVSVDSVAIYSGVLRLNYTGVSCGSIKKTGVIVATLLDYPVMKWKNTACRIKVEFQSYKVLRSDGRTIEFDGTEYLSNLSGNTFYEMRYLNASNLIQTQNATDMKVTFDNDNIAIFSLNRQVTFNYTKSDSVTTCKVEGLGASNGLSNLDNWGQNREGKNFTTQLISPVLWRSSCGTNSPVEGEMQVDVEGKDFAIKCKFGVDSEGESVSSLGTCPFGWQVSWSYKKKTNTKVFAYN